MADQADPITQLFRRVEVLEIIAASLQAERDIMLRQINTLETRVDELVEADKTGGVYPSRNPEVVAQEVATGMRG